MGSGVQCCTLVKHVNIAIGNVVEIACAICFAFLHLLPLVPLSSNRTASLARFDLPSMEPPCSILSHNSMASALSSFLRLIITRFYKALLFCHYLSTHKYIGQILQYLHIWLLYSFHFLLIFYWTRLQLLCWVN